MESGILTGCESDVAEVQQSDSLSFLKGQSGRLWGLLFESLDLLKLI